jgi:hypothetical protein
MEKCPNRLVAAKSRSDDTLLTVDFNLRNMSNIHILQSPAGTTHRRSNKVPSLRDLGAACSIFVRRLKPTVNKVMSLQDISPLTWHFLKNKIIIKQYIYEWIWRFKR